MPQIRGEQITDESITSADIKDGSITGADIADNAISASKVDTRFKEPVTAEVDLPILNNTLGDIRLVTDTKTLFTWNGTGWATVSLVGSPISEWESYAPTFTGFGTPTNISFQWRRDGSNLEIRGRFTSGTVTAVETRVSLPSGCTTRSNISTLEIAGTVIVSNASAASCYVTIEPSKNYFTFGVQASTNAALTKALGTALTQNGYNLSLVASIPISGWTSNINLITNTKEYLFNTQSSVDTSDSINFGSGEEGTPILANTVSTYYDVTSNNIITSRKNITIELRKKNTQIWIDAEQAIVESLFLKINRSYEAASTGELCGIYYTVIDQNKIRVRFSRRMVGGSSWASGATAVNVNWSTLLAASDGFDRWRVKIVSNDNSAESVPTGIYESDYNANGYYVKYVNGTMEQWGWGYITCPGGSSYYTVTKNFPEPFISEDYEIVANTIGYCNLATPTLKSNFTGLGGSFAFAQPSSNSNFIAVAKWTTTFGGTNYQVGYSYHAKGRWSNTLQVLSPGALTGITIEESDSNSNGFYIKFSDGTLIQYGTATVDFSLDTWTVANLNIGTYGWSYYSLSKGPFTLPTSFIDGNYSISAIAGSNQRFMQASTTTTTGFTLVWYNYAATAAVTSFKWQAIGKWK